MTSKKTFMRADKELLKEIEACKLVKGESYADVVKRLINEQKVDYSHDAVVSRLRSKMGEKKWNNMKGRKGQSLMPSGF